VKADAGIPEVELARIASAGASGSIAAKISFFASTFSNTFSCT